MKKLLLGLIVSLFCILAVFGQSTTVSGNVTDAGGQAWAGGTITIQFVPLQGVSQYTWTGGAFGAPQQFITASLDGSGNYSIAVPSNTAITPQGTAWLFVVSTPTTTSVTTSQTLTVTGGTQTVNFTPPAIHLDAGINSPVVAYADSEVSAAVGQFYYNIINQGYRSCIVSSGGNCSSWVNIGGGSGPGGTPRLDQILNPNVNKTFNLGTTTLAFINGSVDFSGLTSAIKLPVIAGCTVASAGQICYDSTLGNWVIFNTAASFIPTLLQSGTYTTNDVLGISNVAGQITLTDLGPLNGTSGASIVQVTTTSILTGDTICWDGAKWINCTPGVPPTTITGTSYPVNCTTDRGAYLLFTAATAIAVSLPQAATSGACDANFFVFMRTINAQLTVTPVTSTINDGGGAGATLVIYPGYGTSIFSDNTSYFARVNPFRESGNPLMSVEGYDVNTLGGYDWQSPNNASPGTALNKMACDDGTGKLQTCAFATAATNNPVGVAVTGIGAAPGTTGNTGICFIGFCKVIFDNSATANHFAQLSTSVNGDLSDTGSTTAPTNGQPYWYVFAGNSGAGTAATIRNLAPSELSAVSIGGGGKSTIQLNGVSLQPIVNFSNTFWTSSNSGNTTTIVPHVNHGISFSIGVPGGTALTSGATTTDYIRVPFACTIKDYSIMIDAGTITVKFWKVATGTAIPTSGNSISTSGVSISSGTAIRSATVSDFTTTAVAANDFMAMNVTAVATAAFVNGVLSCQE